LSARRPCSGGTFGASAYVDLLEVRGGVPELVQRRRDVARFLVETSGSAATVLNLSVPLDDVGRLDESLAAADRALEIRLGVREHSALALQGTHGDARRIRELSAKARDTFGHLGRSDAVARIDREFGMP